LIQNFLGDGNDENVDVLVNGTDVGTFEALDAGFSGNGQTIFFTASFPAIAGPDYSLEFILDNTIPSEGGSIAFFDHGSTTLSSGAVPEPASWALMLAGFGGLGAALRVRRGKLAVA
jgi:hypothetical protein